MVSLEPLPAETFNNLELAKEAAHAYAPGNGFAIALQRSAKWGYSSMYKKCVDAMCMEDTINEKGELSLRVCPSIKKQKVNHDTWYQVYNCAELSPACVITLNRCGWNRDRQRPLLRRPCLLILLGLPCCSILIYCCIAVPICRYVCRCAGANSGVITNILGAGCNSSGSY